MNVKPSETAALVKAIAEATRQYPDVEVVCCTPAIDVPAAVAAAAGTHVGVGTENCHWKESGAYTGEISTGMIVDSGAKYVPGPSSARQTDIEATAMQNAMAIFLMSCIVPYFRGFCRH
jgi:triosephosphate isomerase